MIQTLSLFFALLLSNAAFAGGLLSNRADSGVLSVDEAFRLQPAEYDGRQLRVRWDIAPGHYLYRKRFEFTLIGPAGTQLPKPRLPKGSMQHDEHFGTVEVYRDPSLTAHFAWPKGAPAPQRLRVRYQGCADIGLCYPPQTRTLELAPPAP